ncbi:MAG: LytTR family transcriptional regulator [Rhodobacteraceae bacterium]|nr:LytTR family transcriptional regulator [Paracoccaceae bacterium]
MPFLTRNAVIFWCMTAAVIAYAGPFGTFAGYGWFERVVYWSAVVVISNVFGRVIDTAVTLHVGPGNRLLRDALLVAGMTACFTPVLWALTSILIKSGPGDEPGILRLTLYVSTITLVICGIRRLLPYVRGNQIVPPREDAATPVEADAPGLMRRLPRDARGPVLRLSGRGHHVDVVTPDGVYAVRMRLSDAIAEMDGVSGHITHRSHWVAEAAINRAERTDGKVQLLLRNGDTVPVSRKYIASLHERELI